MFLPMSEKSTRILGNLYETFRRNYLDLRPGSNENDCERAFLCAVAIFTDNSPETQRLIQEVR